MSTVYVLESDAADARFVTFEAWLEKVIREQVRKLLERFDDLGIPRDHPAVAEGLSLFTKLATEKYATERARLEAQQAIKH